MKRCPNCGKYVEELYVIPIQPNLLELRSQIKDFGHFLVSRRYIQCCENCIKDVIYENEYLRQETKDFKEYILKKRISQIFE